MGYDNRVTIERATNGYTVTMRDPKIVAANAKRDYSAKVSTPYRDPEKTYVFTTIDGLNTFLKSNLDKALPADEYGATFDAASGEPDEDMG